MVDFLRDSEGDLLFKNGKLQLTNDVGQRIKTRLKTFKGEWFLDETHGVPYHQSILGKRVSKSTIDTIFKKQILNVKGVEKVLSYKSYIDSKTYYYIINVQTKSKNTVEIKGNI